MGKKLITLNNLNEYLCGQEFYVAKDMILSPSAKDYFREKNIRIVYGDESKEIDTHLIYSILKDEYGILDESTIRRIIKKVEDVIKNGNK